MKSRLFTLDVANFARRWRKQTRPDTVGPRSGERSSGNRGLELIAVLCVCLSSLACLRTLAKDANKNQQSLEKIPSQFLPNVIRLHPKVISGGVPADARAFEELKQLGVKTIISVDGSTPDVTLAQRYGLRYVHLPHGYDGIPNQRALELAKAVRDLDGPIYIHCHHGKHRSPAAATVACVSAGLLAPSRALSVLELAGTHRNYQGLFSAVERARPLETTVLDHFEAHFAESVQVPPLAERMVALEHAFDRLQKLTVHEHPLPSQEGRVDAAHEALLLREHFTELLRGEEFLGNVQYRQLLNESEILAKRLEQTFAARAQPVVSTHRKSQLKQLAEICQSCHTQFRDVPLSEPKL